MDPLSSFITDTSNFAVLGYEMQISGNIDFTKIIFSRIIDISCTGNQDTTYITSRIFEKNKGYYWRARIILLTKDEVLVNPVKSDWSEKKYFDVR